ncbi:unnamed protein product, partial [Macrosiphum euphorbiae]
MTRNKTAPNWRPNVLGPPGHTGKTVFFKATRTHALKVALTPEEKKTTKNQKKFYKKENTKKQYGHSLDNQKDQNLNHGNNNKIGKKATEYLLRIVQLNVEGMTKSKAELISHIFHHADILAL